VEDGYRKYREIDCNTKLGHALTDDLHWT